jgi:SAM-dependent methyltransferase
MRRLSVTKIGHSARANAPPEHLLRFQEFWPRIANKVAGSAVAVTKIASSGGKVESIRLFTDLGQIERHVVSESTPSRPYVLGHSEAELRRLKAQARELDPVSRRFVAEAGIGPGMRVLDVGTGAGDTALLLADVVGPQGEVVGVDRSASGLEAARAKVNERSLRNVSFVQGDADQLMFDAPFDAPFDAVFGRYVLQFQSDPARLLAAVAAHVKPGGLIVFHELDWSGALSVPPAPTYDRLSAWATATIERSGANVHMGLQLPAVFARAGLPLPTLRLDGLIAAGEQARDLLELKGSLAATLATAMVDYGIATTEELDIETLTERMISEAIEVGSVIISRFEVGAWARI